MGRHVLWNDCRMRTSKKDAQLFRTSFLEMSSRHRSNYHGVPLSMHHPSYNIHDTLLLLTLVGLIGLEEGRHRPQ